MGTIRKIGHNFRGRRSLQPEQGGSINEYGLRAARYFLVRSECGTSAEQPVRASQFAPSAQAIRNPGNSSPARGNRSLCPSRFGRGFRTARKKRDECGFVGGFDLDGDTIGTIRIVPIGYELTLAESLFAQLGPDAPPVAEHAWEVGRLVLAHECRSDVDALRRCLYLSLEYAHRHAKVKNLYAACTHVLARLYRRFGFSPIATGVRLPGTDKSYTLIHGDASHVLGCLSSAQVTQ